MGQGTLAAGMGFSLPEAAWLNEDDTYAAGRADNLTREEKTIAADVLVIGGGIAGCFAAIKAREQGVEVVLVNKGYTGKSGQSPFATSFTAFNPEWGDKLDAYMNYLNHVSEYVNNRYWTEKTLKDSYARYQDLVSWGVEFNKDGDGKVLKAPVTEGITQQVQFAHSARDNTPFETTHQYKVRQQVERCGVKILDRILVTELLKQERRIVGAVGIPLDSYDLYTFIAKTTILCAGACSFKPIGYPPLVQLTCDGEAMAYRAGAEILGKEFVDTHCTTFEHQSILARRGMIPEYEALLGRKVVIDNRLGRTTLWTNANGDKIVRAPGVTDYKGTTLEVILEAHAGRAPVYGSDGIEVVGGANLGMSLRKADGLWPANTDCASSLPGLYAAGDSLGNMQNGSLYNLRGNSTAGGAVTGTIAGIAAAKEALKMARPMVSEKEIARAKKNSHAPIERKGGYSPGWVTQLLQNTMMPYFISYIKKADRLQATLTLIGFMQEHLVPLLFARDPHELRLAHETKNMVLSAEMRMRSALFRTESRGNHFREEYPRRDDPNWLAWSKIREVRGKMTLVKVPIPKEWWPNLSTPYEQRYPFRFPGE
jgi:succinate dehydrogenase/fumarate reductase flavoprotein subunit